MFATLAETAPTNLAGLDAQPEALDERSGELTRGVPSESDMARRMREGMASGLWGAGKSPPVASFGALGTASRSAVKPAATLLRFSMSV